MVILISNHYSFHYVNYTKYILNEIIYDALHTFSEIYFLFQAFFNIHVCLNVYLFVCTYIVYVYIYICIYTQAHTP